MSENNCPAKFEPDAPDPETHTCALQFGHRSARHFCPTCLSWWDPDTSTFDAGKHVFEISVRIRFAHGEWFDGVPPLVTQVQAYDISEAMVTASTKSLTEWARETPDDGR
jgi:hypothetical protein